MATKRGISISIKLIVISTVLVIVAVALFGVMNRLRTRRLLDDATARLQTSIVKGLRQAGAAQLQSLKETTRVALVQSDYTTLQTIVTNTKQKDERVLEVVVVDTENTYLAHSDPKQAGKKAPAQVLKLIRDSKLKRGGELSFTGKKSLVFADRVVHEGDEISHVMVAYGLKVLEAELANAQQLKREELQAALKSSLIIGALSVLLGVILAILQGLRISRPIQALARQADQIAEGDLLARAEVKSGDEIGFLGDRFNYMADQVLVLMRETSQKATMEKELEVASAVQSTLVPAGSLFKLNGVSLAGYFKPATQCGGDWWTYYELADGRILLIIGDVTGHGVASAMITAAAKGAASSVVVASDYDIGLQEVLRTMNIAIHDAAKGRFVMTCFASIYDPKTRKMLFANAGHTFPYVKQGDSGRLAALVARGNRLGDLRDSEFVIKETTIAPGTFLVWFTDGIVECVDARGEEFGERRFRNSIKKYSDLPPEEARDAIVERANQFYGDVPPKDDITMVIGKFS